MNKAIIDLETSGFSITKNGLCEIGMLIIDEHFNIILSNNWIIKPYTRPDSDELVSYKDDAMAVHGINMEDILNGKPIDDVLRAIDFILEYYKINTIIGHNFKAFDLPRLTYLFDRFLFQEFQYKIEDTLEMCRERLNLPCNKLESVCKHYGITTNDFHRALGDCYATLEVFKSLNIKI